MKYHCNWLGGKNKGRKRGERSRTGPSPHPGRAEGERSVLLALREPLTPVRDQLGQKRNFEVIEGEYSNESMAYRTKVRPQIDVYHGHCTQT